MQTCAQDCHARKLMAACLLGLCAVVAFTIGQTHGVNLVSQTKAAVAATQAVGFAEQTRVPLQALSSEAAPVHFVQAVLAEESSRPQPEEKSFSTWLLAPVIALLGLWMWKRQQSVPNWNMATVVLQEDETPSVGHDLEAAGASSGLMAGAAPMKFRTFAPWTSGTSQLNTSDVLDENRGSRMVLHAAAKAKPGGKGKGSGIKGKVAGIIKLALPAGKATPAPPVGPALGQYGLNIVAFCKEYNAATEKDAADGMIIPVEITAFEDRSYTFVLKTPPASVLLRKAANVPKGSATPNKVKVGNISRQQLEVVARTKLPDLNTTDIQAAMRIVEGTARQMGITIDA